MDELKNKFLDFYNENPKRVYFIGAVIAFFIVGMIASAVSGG